MQNRRILPPLFKAKEDLDRREDRLNEVKDMKAEGDATRKPDDPTEDGVDKSYTADEVCVAKLLKGNRDAEHILKAILGAGKLDPGQVAKRNETPGALASKTNAPTAEEKAKNPLINRKPNPDVIAKLTSKSEGEDMDIEKAKNDQKEEKAEWAKDPEKEKEEHEEKSYSLDFSKSILDRMGLNKSKKRNESGENFQDGSEDTIGADGHASPARPGTIKHEGGGEGSDNPGTKTKKASMEDGDLEKSDNLMDNKPEEFKDGIEEDDTIPSEKKESKKSYSYDDVNVAILLKSSPFAQDILDSLIKAESAARDEAAAKEHRYNAWRQRSDKRAAKWKSGIEATGRAVQHFKNKADLEDEEAGKSEGDSDLEKGVSYRRGTQSPTKSAAGRHFAREAREEQKAEDTKHKVERASVLGSGGEVTNVSDKVVRVRPHKASTVGSEAKITRSWLTSSVDLHKSLDAILEKARRPSWDPKPKHVDEDKESMHADNLTGDPGSREHEYKRKEELAAKWQAKKNSPEFRAASKIKDSDED